MGRGLGAIQRELLAALERNKLTSRQQAAEGLSITELAADYLGLPRLDWSVDRAELSAAHRALKGLERPHLVVCLGKPAGRSYRWRASARSAA
jgi:hypothetical protein